MKLMMCHTRCLLAIHLTPASARMCLCRQSGLNPVDVTSHDPCMWTPAQQEGITPSILFSLPGNQSQLLAVDSKEITRLVSVLHPLQAAQSFVQLRTPGQLTNDALLCR